MTNGRYVAYYRTSTKDQSLGIDAQRDAVRSYLNGGDWQLIGEFEEQESGKRHENRAQLVAAMAMAKRHKATLIIGKLDRLARNVHFITGLQEAKVDFVLCDYPNADKMMVQIMSVFAEHERDMIARRTTEALKAAKARGVVLGNRTNLDTASALGAASNARKADVFAENILPIIERIKATGATSLRAVAAELNARGVKTARGAQWSPVTVRAICLRA